MSKVIEVTQKPIIEYSVIDEVAKKVEAKIESLDINTLEPTDENLSLIKSTRAELNNDFKTLEEQRKLVKDIVLKDYNIFEDKYKKLIASKFREADATLRGLVQTVTDEILRKKIECVKRYFYSVNTYDFVTFGDLAIRIIKSKSDKKIKEEVDEYLATIKQSLETIETLQNKDRVLAKFQMSKNLSDAIAQTNMEIQREGQIKSQKEARAKEEQEIKNQKIIEDACNKDPMPSIRNNNAPKTDDEKERVAKTIQMQEEKQKTFKSSFTVYGTREQFQMLKQFMNENNIKYEGASK